MQPNLFLNEVFPYSRASENRPERQSESFKQNQVAVEESFIHATDTQPKHMVQTETIKSLYGSDWISMDPHDVRQRMLYLPL